MPTRLRHDPLTGLVNRREFESRLQRVLASCHEPQSHILLYLDLDQFKSVNDTCGHGAGDELLRQVSVLLRSKIRARDTVARLGGDEFGILLENCSEAQAMRIANSLRKLIKNFHFDWQDKTLHYQCEYRFGSHTARRARSFRAIGRRR